MPEGVSIPFLVTYVLTYCYLLTVTYLLTYGYLLTYLLLLTYCYLPTYLLLLTYLLETDHNPNPKPNPYLLTYCYLLTVIGNKPVYESKFPDNDRFQPVQSGLKPE